MIFMGLDVGSSGCKCVAFSEIGKQLYNSYQEYSSVAGQSDMDANEMLSAVLNVIKDCANNVDSREIGAISVTSFGESFVPIDKDGNALSCIIMYTDKRGKDEVQNYIDKVGYERIMHITCDKPDSMYSLPKIGWSIANIEAVRNHVWKFLQIADYICYKLSGETVINYSLACRSMAFDLENRCWSDEILAAANIDKSYLSTPVPCGSIVGNIITSLATQLKIPASTKIVISSHDQVSAAIGAGVLKSGEAVDGTGSVECITPVFDKIIRNSEFTRKNYVCVPHAIDGLYATYAFNFSGGVLLKWFRDCFATHLKLEAKNRKVSVYRLLDEMCAKEPSSVMVIPHFLGAGGTPDMIADATGSITGLTMKSGLADIYRAMMEGLTFEMAYNIDEISKYGIVIDTLRATGGGAKSAIWLQIKADILNKPIIPLKTDEAGAAGSAMLAAVAMGKYSNLHEAAQKFVNLDNPIFPNSKLYDVYNEKFDKYKKIRNTLIKD